MADLPLPVGEGAPPNLPLPLGEGRGEGPALSQLEYLQLAASVAGVEVAEFVTPEDHTIRGDGLNLHYLDWGGPATEPIVFLHGGHLTAHTWDLVCLSLRPNFRCYALDARGHGDSDWAPGQDYGLDGHVGDVTALVEHLGLDRFLLVGHSMGGGTAIGYAGRNSDRLKALVLVDTGPRYDGQTNAPGHERMRNFVEGPAKLPTVEHFVERAVEFNPARDRRLLRRSLLHNLRQLPDGDWTWKYDRDGLRFRGGVQEDRQAALKALIPHIHCPTLVLRGGRSDIFSDEQAELVVQHLPNARWQRVENAGHTIQGDNARGFVDAVRPFFAEVLA